MFGPPEKDPTEVGVEPEAFTEATICPLHEVFAKRGTCHFCNGDRRLIVVRKVTSPDEKDVRIAALGGEVHRMRVQLGGLKGWCERNGHDYALSLVLAAFGPENAG